MSEDGEKNQGTEATGFFGQIRLLGWIALILAAALYGHFQVHRAWATIRSRGMLGNDFKHIYLGAVLLRQGQSPYDGEGFLRSARQYGFGEVNPYVYPPANGLALRPLTWWTPREAMRVWFWFNHAMALAALAFCVHFFVGWRNPWLLALAVLLAATSYPLRRTLTAGQLNGVLLLLYCGVYWGLRTRRDWFAALMVGFGALFKLVPGIFLIYFLWKRRWRAVGWTGVWFVVILLASVAVVGWQVHADYWPTMRGMGYGRSVWQERLIAGGADPFYRDPFNQSCNSLFHHLFAPDPVGQMQPLIGLEGERGWQLANAVTVLNSLILLALAFGAVGWRGAAWPPVPSSESPVSSFEFRVSGSELRAEQGESRRLALEVGLMICLSLLLPSIMWDHYLVVLFLPQLILVGGLAAGRPAAIWRVGVWMVASVLIAVPVAFWPHMLEQRGFPTAGILLATSMGLYGTLILCVLLVLAVLEARCSGKMATGDPQASHSATFLG